jgi:mannose/fructose/N-acetylgalactosamine-specific phosphotransferase system component IIC
MGYEILLAGIWGGIVATDTTAALQLMISHPIVSCSVIGLLFGNLPIGFFIGILLELPWLYEIPAGSARFDEGNVGSTSAAAIAIHLMDETSRIEIGISLSILVGIIVSVIGGALVIFMRPANARLTENVSTKNNVTPASITRQQLIGVGQAFLLGAVLTAGSYYFFGYLILPILISFIPTTIDTTLSPVFSALMGVGCAVFLILIIKKRTWWLFVIGLLIGSLAFLI